MNDLSEPRQLGKYQLLECIAHGGMGTVWKALDTQLQRLVAIKLLRSENRNLPDFVARFEHEAQLVASLSHPNIVKIHNFHVSLPPESDPPLFYMVMDYVEGQTLADYLRRTSHCGLYPSEADILYILTGVSLALDYAHERGMIHRDIKPANILLDQRVPTARLMGEPVLTDFGIARQQGSAAGTVIGSVIGTPLYIPPEQALGKYDDCRSDLYSLGIILYEMVTGVLPFHGDTAMGIVMQHVYETPTPPILVNPRISQEVSDVVLKSIAKKPDDRFPSAVALTIALVHAYHLPLPERLVPPEDSSPSGKIYPEGFPSRTSSSLLNVSTPPGQHVSVLNPRKDPVTPLESLLNVPSNPLVSPSTKRPDPVSESGLLPAIPSNPSVPFVPASNEKRHVKPDHKKLWKVALPALLLVVLLSSGLSMIFLFHQQNTSSTTIVGYINFLKQNNVYSALQIDIQNVPNPPSAMTYYAWIKLPGEATYYKWPLQVKQQKITEPSLPSPGGQNLLAPNALFLITKEQSGGNFLDVPNPDPSTRLYYARAVSEVSPHLNVQQCPADPSVCAG